MAAVANLNNRKSLSIAIAFLAISDQYAFFLFNFFQNANFGSKWEPPSTVGQWLQGRIQDFLGGRGQVQLITCAWCPMRKGVGSGARLEPQKLWGDRRMIQSNFGRVFEGINEDFVMQKITKR